MFRTICQFDIQNIWCRKILVTEMEEIITDVVNETQILLRTNRVQIENFLKNSLEYIDVYIQIQVTQREEAMENELQKLISKTAAPQKEIDILLAQKKSVISTLKADIKSELDLILFRYYTTIQDIQKHAKTFFSRLDNFYIDTLAKISVIRDAYRNSHRRNQNPPPQDVAYTKQIRKTFDEVKEEHTKLLIKTRTEIPELTKEMENVVNTIAEKQKNAYHELIENFKNVHSSASTVTIK